MESCPEVLKISSCLKRAYKVYQSVNPLLRARTHHNHEQPARCYAGRAELAAVSSAVQRHRSPDDASSNFVCIRHCRTRHALLYRKIYIGRVQRSHSPQCSQPSIPTLSRQSHCLRFIDNKTRVTSTGPILAFSLQYSLSRSNTRFLAPTLASHSFLLAFPLHLLAFLLRHSRLGFLLLSTRFPTPFTRFPTPSLVFLLRYSRLGFLLRYSLSHSVTRFPRSVTRFPTPLLVFPLLLLVFSLRHWLSHSF